MPKVVDVHRAESTGSRFLYKTPIYRLDNQYVPGTFAQIPNNSLLAEKQTIANI